MRIPTTSITTRLAAGLLLLAPIAAHAQDTSRVTQGVTLGLRYQGSRPGVLVLRV